ncbi:MAG: Ig-like domain-containing protein, partial [Verrucomicrobiota bacterium]
GLTVQPFEDAARAIVNGDSVALGEALFNIALPAILPVAASKFNSVVSGLKARVAEGVGTLKQGMRAAGDVAKTGFENLIGKAPARPGLGPEPKAPRPAPVEPPASSGSVAAASETPRPQYGTKVNVENLTKAERYERFKKVMDEAAKRDALLDRPWDPDIDPARAKELRIKEDASLIEGQFDELGAQSSDKYRAKLELGTPEILGERSYPKVSAFSVGQDVLRTMENWKEMSLQPGWDGVNPVTGFTFESQLRLSEKMSGTSGPKPKWASGVADFSGVKGVNRVLVDSERGGRLIYERDGRPVVSDPAREMLFVMDTSGRKYVIQMPKGARSSPGYADFIAHSSLLGVEAKVLFAGTIDTLSGASAGIVEAITPMSGHFSSGLAKAAEAFLGKAPDPGFSMNLAFSIMKKQGAELSNATIRLFDSALPENPKYVAKLGGKAGYGAPGPGQAWTPVDLPELGLPAKPVTPSSANFNEAVNPAMQRAPASEFSVKKTEGLNSWLNAMPGELPRPSVLPPSGSPLNAAPANTSGVPSGVGASPTSVTATASPQSAINDLLTPVSLSETVGAARQLWERVLGRPVQLSITIVPTTLPAGELGYAVIDEFGPDGLPTAGRLLIDTTGNGRGWFIDSTPLQNDEFISTSVAALTAAPGTKAAGRYDLLTLVTHEMGHLLGFTQNFSGFAALVEQGLGSASFLVGDGLHELLTADGDHLSPTMRPGALMTPYLAAGVRRQPSELEGRMLREAWDAAEADRNAGGKPSFQLAPGVFGFSVLSEVARAGLDNPNATLVNGGFTVSGAAAGWTLIGGASISGGQGVLTRGSGMLSELVQTFTVPDRGQTLQFTVTGYQLAGGGVLPPDAFEVGLFDTSAGGSLLSPGTLSGTDSIINLQGGGALTLGPGVQLVSGSVGTGGALVFSVDLSGVTAGTVATLTFDLVGIGNRDSQVAVDDVTLVTSPDAGLPVVTNESYTTTRNLPLDIPAERGVLANDSDPFNRTLAAILVQAPNNGTLDLNPDGSFRYVPNQDFVGQDQFIYRARTGSVVSDLGTVTISVTALEQRPPQFVKGADQTVAENAGAQRIVGWATNIAAGLPTPAANATLNFVLSVDRPELFAALPGVSADGGLTFEAKPFISGVAKVTVQLHDNGGTKDGRVDTSDSQVFTITILPVNQPPAFTKGPDLTVGSNAGAQTIDNWATGITLGPANENDQTANFIATADRPELFAVAPEISPDGTLTFTPSVGVVGSAIVTVVLRDDGSTENGGNDTSQPQTFAITIVSVSANQPPTFTKGPDVTVSPNAGQQTIEKWASDITPGPANEAAQTLGFIVTVDSPELFAVAPQITPTGTLTFVPNDGVSGRAIITVVLRDNGGTDNGGRDTSEAQSFAITITVANPSANQPPTFTKGPDVSIPFSAGGQTIENWATGIAPGPASESGQTVNFVVTVDHPELFTVAPQITPTGTLTFAAKDGVFGHAVMTIVLRDNGGTANGGHDTSEAQSFAIVIASPSANQPPSFTKGPDVSVPSNAGAQTIESWATDITPGPANEGGQTVSFVLTVDHPELFTVAPQIAPNGVLTFTPNAGGFGLTVVTVVARDNGGTDNGGQDT